MKVSAIKKNPNNPRILRDEKFKKLCKSIKDFPQMMELRPIVVDEDGVILGGNMRFEALKANGLKEIPDAWVKRAGELTEEQKREFIVKDNVGFGDWDWDALANEWDSGKLTEWGLDLPDYQEVALEAKEEDEEQVAETISKAKELQEKWQTAPGQLWKLGDHRLLCGDSTRAEDIERLIGADVIDMVFADPPYGISIVNEFGSLRSNTAQPFGGRGSDGASKPFGKVGFGEKGKNKLVHAGVYAPIVGDDSTDTAITAYLLTAKLVPKAAQIWWGGNYYANVLPPSSCWIVWDKENTGNFADAELAWTNQKTAVRIFKHMWNGLMKASERGEARVHPTQKPVALAEWCFENYGKDGDTVFDPFLGSAMSLIAAENKKRKLRGCELSPEYVAVALQRWADYTGKTPELIDG